MKIKNILNKLRALFTKNNEIISDDSYCYSQIVWKTKDNIIILLSFTENYFEQIMEIQDAINYSWQGLCSKIVYSSYEEEVTAEDEDGTIYDTQIVHKKYYMLIGGSPLAWQELYMNIHDLGNEVLNKITDEITNNCDPFYFKNLIDDGILYNFRYSEENEMNYDASKVSKNNYTYTDPEVLLKRLPNGFTGRDILKFIKVCHGTIVTNGLSSIIDVKYMPDNLFKNHGLYPLYAAVFKDPTIEKLNMVLEPLYKQPDDDSIPGDVSDESLDAIFREHYEKFSAVADDSTHYEDIDEQLSDDEESENMHERDKM